MYEEDARSLLKHSGLRFFFFPSRRRHTRCSRDWSSDVCSSDLRSSGNRTNAGRSPAHRECRLTDYGPRSSVSRTHRAAERSVSYALRRAMTNRFRVSSTLPRKLEELDLSPEAVLRQAGLPMALFNQEKILVSTEQFFAL